MTNDKNNIFTATINDTATSLFGDTEKIGNSLVSLIGSTGTKKCMVLPPF